MKECTCAPANQHPRRERALEGYIAAHAVAHLCLVGLENHSIIVSLLADAGAVRDQTLCPGGPWAVHLLQTEHTRRSACSWCCKGRTGVLPALPCRPANRWRDLNSVHLHS